MLLCGKKALHAYRPLCIIPEQIGSALVAPTGDTDDPIDLFSYRYLHK
jgi:hypothetical protein